MRLFFSRRQGFTLTEVLMSLILVSLGILIVGALAQQVANLSKSSKQSGAVIELRNKTNAISRDTSAWLQKMRSQVSVNGIGIFAGCIPDALSGISTYKCPEDNPSLVNSDSELKKIANGLYVIDVPLVDVMGEPLAGTLSNPVYLDIEGRLCETSNQALHCAFKSTGYFLRKNKATNENPQEVSFVLKIEKNSSATGNALLSTPMRPQYMVVDIGREWVKPSIASKTCKSGTVKVGYLLDGSPQCLSATKKCDSNKIQLGIDENGEPICASKPTTCLETESIVFDHSSKSLICSSSSPCSVGSFVGYYLGTGQSMCYVANPPCGEGKIQVGQSSVNGSPQCVSVAACTTEKPFLSFNGTSFSCLETPTGLDGARGVAGDSGTPGTPGQPGPNGSSGPSGENGVDGNSAYSPKVFAYDQAPELYLFTKSMTTESNPKFRKWYTVDYDYPADAKYIVISAKCLEAISLWRYSDQTNIFPPPLPTLFYGDGSSKALRDHLVCWAANNAGDTATFRIEIPRAPKKLQFLTDPVNDDVNLVDVRIVGFE